MEGDNSAIASSAQTLLPRCASLDLEVNPKTAQIFAFAAVHQDRSDALSHRKGDLAPALDRLEG